MLKFLFLIALLCYTTISSAEVTLQAQANYAPPNGFIGSALIEFQGESLSKKIALTGRFASMGYEYTDGDYWEDGYGSAYGPGMRYYSNGEASGFYLGAELLMFNITVDSGGWGWYGTTWIEGMVPTITLGSRIPLQANLFIKPQGLIALVGVAGSDAEVPVILGAGLGIGIAF
ncbi:MAG: hypothetical protein OEZ58_18480 [Gammaproteobacteria bacterium]|nr:hypothetical protein [Gammaproteobacteria bacterium]